MKKRNSKRMIETIFFKKFLGDDGFQNMFIYQPLFDTTTLELKKYKGTDYVLVGN